MSRIVDVPDGLRDSVQKRVKGCLGRAILGPETGQKRANKVKIRPIFRKSFRDFSIAWLGPTHVGDRVEMNLPPLFAARH
jgi:hypothetical protein